MGATVTLTDNTGTTGDIRVQWPGSSEPANFYSWKVFQRSDGKSVWTEIYESFVSTGSTITLDTYAWANGIEQEFAAVGVSQNPTTGRLTLQDFSGADSITPVGNTKYTLVHPIDPNLSVLFGLVTGESYSTETDHQVMRLLGDENGQGSRRKINRGVAFGREGSFDTQIYDSATYGTAKAQLDKLEAIEVTGDHVFLRDPFGSLLKVFISGVSVSRVPGVGTSEAAEVTINYIEVG